MKSLHVILFAVRAGAVAAQEAGPKPVDRTLERAREMRGQIKDGGVLTSHVKVRVKLNNGNRLTGVVKDGRLVERVNGLRFVRAEAGERGAGMRLWLSGTARSFVFVPFDSLESYEVLQRLSPKQLLELWSKLGEEQSQAAARRKRAEREAAERAAAQTASSSPAPAPTSKEPAASLRNPPPGPDGLADWKPTREPESAASATDSPASDAAAEPAADPAADPAVDAAKLEKEPESAPSEAESEQVTVEAVQQQLRWSELLRKFPPSQGWSEARRDEISRRFVVVGTQPSAVEKEFVAQFDQWVKACRANEIEPVAGGPQRPKTRGEKRREARARRRQQRN